MWISHCSQASVGPFFKKTPHIKGRLPECFPGVWQFHFRSFHCLLRRFCSLNWKLRHFLKYNFSHKNLCSLEKMRISHKIVVSIQLPVKHATVLFWRRQWHPTPVLLHGKSHGWRSLVGCSPWGRYESNSTERLHFHFSLSCIGEGNGTPLQYSCM